MHLQQGKNALMHAVLAGDLDLFEISLFRCVAAGQQDAKDNVRDVLILVQHQDEANYIYSRGKVTVQPSLHTIHATLQSGNTALHYAAKMGRHDMVAMLLRNCTEPRPLNHEGKKPIDLWPSRGGGVGLRYSLIEAAASKKPCVGPVDRIVCGVTIPMKLRLLYWQGDSVSPREVLASGVIGGIKEMLEYSKTLPDNSMKHVGIYSALRCGLHVVAALLRLSCATKCQREATDGIRSAAKLASAILHLPDNKDSKQLLVRQKHGIFSANKEAVLYTGPTTRFPPSGAGKFVVGLLTDSAELGIQDLVSALTSRVLTNRPYVPLQVVQGLFRLTAAFVLVPFRIVTCTPGLHTPVQTSARQIMQLLLTTRVQCVPNDEQVIINMGRMCIDAVVKESRDFWYAKTEDILHPVPCEDSTPIFINPLSGKPCCYNYPDGQSKHLRSSWENEASRRDRMKLARWRRAVEARRDAGRVFRAAAEGRPLELGKRLRLGRLAGGLEIKGKVDGTTASVGPLQAARLGGHAECVRVLEEAIAELKANHTHTALPMVTRGLHVVYPHA